MKLTGKYTKDAVNFIFYPTNFVDASTTWNPANIVNNASTSVVVNITGVKMTDFAWASLSTDVQGLALNAPVSSTSNVTCILMNNTGGAINLGDSTLYVRVMKR